MQIIASKTSRHLAWAFLLLTIASAPRTALCQEPVTKQSESAAGRGDDWLREKVRGENAENALGAEEVSNDEQFLVAEGSSPEVLDLGKLRTGTKYFTEISLVNMLEQPIQISKVSASCGCLTAKKLEVLTNSGDEATFAAAEEWEVERAILETQDNGYSTMLIKIFECHLSGTCEQACVPGSQGPVCVRTATSIAPLEDSFVGGSDNCTTENEGEGDPE